MTIPLADIKKLAENLLAYLDKQDLQNIYICSDYYWSISYEDAYNLAIKPTECAVGSLNDDYEWLKKVLLKSNPATTLDCERLGNIIQSIGEYTVNDAIHQATPLFSINLNDIRSLIELLLQKAHRANFDLIDTQIDNYWDIAPEDRYTFDKEPFIVTRSFRSDIDLLQKNLLTSTTPLNTSFASLGRLLKVLGEEINNSPNKIKWLICE